MTPPRLPRARTALCIPDHYRFLFERLGFRGVTDCEGFDSFGSDAIGQRIRCGGNERKGKKLLTEQRGTVFMPAFIWTELVLSGRWVEDSVVRRWAGPHGELPLAGSLRPTAAGGRRMTHVQASHFEKSVTLIQSNLQSSAHFHP